MQIAFAYQILNLDFSNTSEGVTIFARLGHIVAKEAVDSLQRFPLSAVSHNDCKSFIKGLHPKNRSTELILYSDGSLEVDQQNKLLDDGSMVVLNVNDLENIEYSNGRYKYRIIYQTLGLISLLSGLAACSGVSGSLQAQQTSDVVSLSSPSTPTLRSNTKHSPFQCAPPVSSK